eukprot:scaffold14628_cov118-Isochrysis_galbana.AAC.2
MRRVAGGACPRLARSGGAPIAGMRRWLQGRPRHGRSRGAARSGAARRGVRTSRAPGPGRARPARCGPKGIGLASTCPARRRGAKPNMAPGSGGPGSGVGALRRAAPPGRRHRLKRKPR